MNISDLEELEKASIARGIPIIGREKGKWLLKKIQEIKPNRILELGTANGYSGIILGSEGAELTTIEIDEKIAEEAMQNFVDHNIDARVLIGDGVEIIKELAEKHKELFDLIFIDFAKKKYNLVLEDCIGLVKINGFIIADNITFEGCQDFKKNILHHPQLETEIIEIKDGLSMSKKV